MTGFSSVRHFLQYCKGQVMCINRILRRSIQTKYLRVRNIHRFTHALSQQAAAFLQAYHVARSFTSFFAVVADYFLARSTAT